MDDMNGTRLVGQYTANVRMISENAIRSSTLLTVHDIIPTIKGEVMSGNIDGGKQGQAGRMRAGQQWLDKMAFEVGTVALERSARAEQTVVSGLDAE